MLNNFCPVYLFFKVRCLVNLFAVFQKQSLNLCPSRQVQPALTDETSADWWKENRKELVWKHHPEARGLLHRHTDHQLLGAASQNH